MTLDVPRIHGESNSTTTRIEYEIWSEGASGPPVLFLCGGPGERATHLQRVLPWQALAARRPIVLLNQRGSQIESGPLQLSSSFFVDPDAAFEQLSAQAKGIDGEGIDPWQSAQDIAFLADALGVERLDVIAHSYGTHLTMAAMKAVPTRLGRLVMLGFEGPDQTFKFSHPFELALKRLGYDQKVEDLCEREIQVDIEGQTVMVGEFGLRWMLSSWLGLEARVKRLPDLLSDPEQQFAKAFGGFFNLLVRRSPMYYLCDSASGCSDVRAQRLVAQTSPWARAVNFPFPKIADAYGQSRLDESFRANPEWDGEVLVLTGEYDAFTPTSNFTEAGSGLTQAVHREIPGAYHDTLLVNSQVGSQVVEWFLERMG